MKAKVLDEEEEEMSFRAEEVKYTDIHVYVLISESQGSWRSMCSTTDGGL